MQKWEYYWNNVEKEWLNEELYERAENGWELVAVTQHETRYTLFFKRPKE